MALWTEMQLLRRPELRDVLPHDLAAAQKMVVPHRVGHAHRPTGRDHLSHMRRHYVRFRQRWRRA